MSSKDRTICVVALTLLTLPAGCTTSWDPGSAGSLGGEAPGRIGEDLRIVQVFDEEGLRRAVGVAPIHEEQPGPASGADAPVFLAVLEVGAEANAVFPVGDLRVVDAALGPRPDDVALLTGDGRICRAAADQDPACSEVPALPAGMDVAPDGRVVFVADTGAGSNIWTIDPRTRAGARRLTFGPGYRDRPTCDPTGSQVVYVGPSRTGLASLFRVSAMGGEPTQLTNVGLAPGLAGSDRRLPAEYVPPPASRHAMRWDAMGIRFQASGAEFVVDPVSGSVRTEAVQ
jgi:hypothetical protein